MNAYDTEQLGRIEPAYLANYGLREAPFSSVHQDKFLYLDAERAQRLNLLQHMTQYSNLLLMVQGERGAGKTSLMTRFINNAEPEWRVCQVSANTMMDAEQLMFQAAQGFDIEQLPQDAAQLQEMLYARVATIHHNNEVPILIIDDAHELPKDALLAIFNLADTYVDEENLLRIILFCEPQIEKILGAKDVKVLRERITHTMVIPALDEDITAEYLKHRLAVAGFAGGSPFTPKMVKRIYKASHGLPGIINELAHETLEHGDFEKDVPDDIVTINTQKKQPRTLVFASAAVIVIAVLLVFQDSINNLFNDSKPSSESTVVADGDKEIKPAPEVLPAGKAEFEKTDVLKKIIPLNPEALVESKVKSVEQPVENPAENSESITGSVPSEAIVPENTITTKVSESMVKEEPKPELQSIKLLSLEPDTLPGSVKSQTITIHGQGFTPQSEVTVGWTGKEVKLPPHKVEVKSEAEIKINIKVGRNADNWSIQVSDPGKGRSNSLGFQVTGIEDPLLKGERWVLAQSPAAFTLQLFGTNLKKNADEFIARHGIKAQSAYFFTQRNGKDWYSVVYGDFADQITATQTIKKLPAALQKLKPWVRRFDDIHASINASRKVVANKPKKILDRSTKIPLATSSLPANASTEQHASWLWSQDPRSFTLQLLGARQSDSVNKFLRKYTNLNGKAVYFHTRHNARDWYTVVYGVYPDKSAAKKAIERLPPELKSSSPWIRSFASIHAELDRAE